MAKKKNIPAAEAAPVSQFEHEGKTYNVSKGCIVPFANGAEKLTAADICASPEAQKILVAMGASCIQEAE